jgi:hypothetical protein
MTECFIVCREVGRALNVVTIFRVTAENSEINQSCRLIKLALNAVK